MLKVRVYGEGFKVDLIIIGLRVYGEGFKVDLIIIGLRVKDSCLSCLTPKPGLVWGSQFGLQFEAPIALWYVKTPDRKMFEEGSSELPGSRKLRGRIAMVVHGQDSTLQALPGEE